MKMKLTGKKKNERSGEKGKRWRKENDEGYMGEEKERK